MILFSGRKLSFISSDFYFQLKGEKLVPSHDHHAHHHHHHHHEGHHHRKHDHRDSESKLITSDWQQ